MFGKYGLLSNFSWLRRLHLSFLLPGVLTYVVLFHATVKSIYAQTVDLQAPATNTVKAPVIEAPLDGIIKIPVQGAPTENVVVPNGLIRSDVITWSGDVEFKYEQEKIIATAEKAEYYKSEQKIVLTGKVKIRRAGQSQEVETATFFVTSEFKITADKIAGT